MFRKKPVVVEAWQWDGDAPSETDPPWIREAYAATMLHYEPGCLGCGRYPCLVLERDDVDGGDVGVAVRDWLVLDVNGEIRHYTRDVFAQTYEPVEEGAPVQEPPVGCAPRWLRELCKSIAVRDEGRGHA